MGRSARVFFLKKKVKKIPAVLSCRVCFSHVFVAYVLTAVSPHNLQLTVIVVKRYGTIVNICTDAAVFQTLWMELTGTRS